MRGVDGSRSEGWLEAGARGGWKQERGVETVLEGGSNTQATIAVISYTLPASSRASLLSLSSSTLRLDSFLPSDDARAKRIRNENRLLFEAGHLRSKIFLVPSSKDCEQCEKIAGLGKEERGKSLQPYLLPETITRSQFLAVPLIWKAAAAKLNILRWRRQSGYLVVEPLIWKAAAAKLTSTQVIPS
ncbi:hypothetical protein K435DRAFT_812698 [Dendrothele bispora CBS 962.96]|uniref:Uncharacterized protein n=1 Tax=Dendrothele bispora (strain CBS 962.96) TaxID=1314807 RepID=A0A4S8KND9_DENBC|nr:hypothetical protein K435DRAFT_812698 [Dendrothele bispora CBS 962.96]